MKTLRALLLVGFCLLSASGLRANDETEQYKNQPLSTGRLDKEKWQKASGGLHYEGTRKESRPAPVNSRPTNTPRIDTPDIDGSGFELFSKFLLYGALIALGAFILYKIVASGLVTKPETVKDGQISFEEIEANLHEADVNKFLKATLESRDYKSSVRLYYLAVLKSLSLQGKIEWQRDKTNGAYMSEMRRYPELIGGFGQVTRIFEYTWYNEQTVLDANIFQQIEPIFLQYQKTIG